MAKFMFLYRNTRNSSESHGNMSPEEMQKIHQKWHDWMKEGFQKGWLLDNNGVLQDGRVVDAKKVVTDGPFIEAKEIVGGYSIVQADTLDAATELAKGCPWLLLGSSVEVRPVWKGEK